MSAPPPPYVMLQGSQHGQPTPYRYNAGSYHSNHNKRSSYVGLFFRCICCCLCCIFLILLSIGVTIFLFFYLYKPRMPKYEVTDFNVKTFDIQPDFSVVTDFQVTVRADNPNKYITFTYEKDNQVILSYSGTNICTGKVPSFHQGRQNTTVIKVDLHGKIESGSSLMQAVTQNKNEIPLLARVKVPMIIVVGKIRLNQITVFLNSTLLVDSLAPNKKIGVRTNDTNYETTV